MKRIFLMIIGWLTMWQVAMAQKTCVIASAENHVPIREALIHTNNNHWARTDYRGYWNMRYQFDSATVSKPGYIKATIRYKELPDTVFLLPEAHQVGEVTIWGKNQEHINEMEEQIQEKVNSIPSSPSGVGFDAFGWMDRQGKRDQKHLKEAKKIFKKMDTECKDPVVAAYEKATGKKYELKTPYEMQREKQDSVEAEKAKPTAMEKIAAGAVYTVLEIGKAVNDLKTSDEQKPEPIKKETWPGKLDENLKKMRNPTVKIDTSVGVTK